MQADALLSEWRASPLRFIHDVWPDATPWAAQVEIANSFRDNYATIVSSCVESGKDWIAARLVLWFYATRFPCRIVCTSTSLGQMRRSLWGEIGRALREARVPLGIDRKHLLLRRIGPDGRPFEEDWMQLVAVSQIENLMGVHLAGDADNPAVAVVVDESSGVPDERFESLEAQAHRILSIGNPLRVAGWVAGAIRRGDVPDEFRPGKLRRKVIQIDGRRTPNVAAGVRWDEAGRHGPCPSALPGLMSYADFVHRQAEWPEFRVQTCLYGRLVEGIESMVMVPRSWLEEARKAWFEVDREARKSLRRCMGIDASHGRGDLAVWVVADQCGVLDVRTATLRDRAGEPDTVLALEITREAQAAWGVAWQDVAVDIGGGGQEAIVDRLKREGVRVHGVDFGAGASTPARRRLYRNMRAELYGELALECDPSRWRRIEGPDGPVLERGFTLPHGANLRAEVEALVEELSLIPREQDGEGKLLLPPKDRRPGQKTGRCLREMLGHSPDRSDALALCVWRVRNRAAFDRHVDSLRPPPADFDPRKTELWRRIMGAR